MQVLGHEVKLIGKNASENEWVYVSCDGAEAVSGTKLPPEVLKEIRAMPRTRINSVGFPYVMWDGHEELLAYWAQNEEERAIYNSKRGKGAGSGISRAKVSEHDKEVRAALVEFKGALPEELQNELQGIISKFFPSEEEIAEQKKMDAARALLASLTDEQKKLLGL